MVAPESLNSWNAPLLSASYVLHVSLTTNTWSALSFFLVEPLWSSLITHFTYTISNYHDLFLLCILCTSILERSVPRKLVCSRFVIWILYNCDDDFCFQNVVRPLSTVGHIGIGGLTLLGVVFGLRWELRPLLEKILDSAASVMTKFAPVRWHHFFQVTLVGSVRKILYNTWP